MSGKSLPYAMSILIPESINAKNPISPELRAFLSVSFYFYGTMGRSCFTYIFRWTGILAECSTGMDCDHQDMLLPQMILLLWVQKQGFRSFAPEEIREKGRLKPGKMLLVDTLEGKIFYDDELKAKLADEFPYGEWIKQNMVKLEEIETGHDDIT